MTLRCLDLFSGIGGFALAAQMVGGIETRQFVEIDPYCQKVLAKNFPGIPIHDDIRTYTANPGDFDLITGGFPCQPHSQAGKRKASEDKRDLWPELYRVICQVQPKWCVFENVRGLLNSESGRFFRGILWDLACAGFDAEWAVIPASDLGACHRRERVWIVAYSNGKPPAVEKFRSSRQKRQHTKTLESALVRQKHGAITSEGSAADSLSTSNTTGARCYSGLCSSRQESEELTSQSKRPDDSVGVSANSNRKGLEVWQLPAVAESSFTLLKRLDSSNGRGFATQPLLCRGDDGIPNRIHRIRGLGNAVVPQVAAIALQRVLELQECGV